MRLVGKRPERAWIPFSGVGNIADPVETESGNAWEVFRALIKSTGKQLIEKVDAWG